MTVISNQVPLTGGSFTPIPINSDAQGVLRTGYIEMDIPGAIVYTITDDQGNVSEPVSTTGPVIFRFQYCNYQYLNVEPPTSGVATVVITDEVRRADFQRAQTIANIDPEINQLWPDQVPVTAVLSPVLVDYTLGGVVTTAGIVLLEIEGTGAIASVQLDGTPYNLNSGVALANGALYVFGILVSAGDNVNTLVGATLVESFFSVSP